MSARQHVSVWRVSGGRGVVFVFQGAGAVLGVGRVRQRFYWSARWVPESWRRVCVGGQMNGFNFCVDFAISRRSRVH